MAPTILESAAVFFEEDGWGSEQVEHAPALRMRFQGENEEWICLAIAREEQRQFVFYSVLDGFVTQGRRQQAEEFLTRANWTMAMGNFEMDVGTGEVRYKTSVDVGAEDLTTNLVRRAVYSNVLNMNRYLPGLRAVLNGDLVPAAAVQMVEDALG